MYLSSKFTEESSSRNSQFQTHQNINMGGLKIDMHRTLTEEECGKSQSNA